MSPVRQARAEDAGRIAEILVFNYRLNFYPIFRDDDFYFRELAVSGTADSLLRSPSFPGDTWVWDDGAVKGFVTVSERSGGFSSSPASRTAASAPPFSPLPWRRGGPGSSGRWKKTCGRSGFTGGTAFGSPATAVRRMIPTNSSSA